MAFDDKTRGRLQKLVTTCRGLLTDEFRIQVQQTYGLDPNTGDVTPLERLTHLSAAERETADLLRQTLAHYLASEGLADSAAQRRVDAEGGGVDLVGVDAENARLR